MNYPGHIGFGILTFGVCANVLDIANTHSSLEITGFLALAIFSASKIIDQDLKFAVMLPKDMRHKRYLYHRQITHSLTLWLALLIYSIFDTSSLSNIVNLKYDINYYLLFFTIGGLSHLIADMLTGSIPIFLWGKYNRGFRIGLNFSDSFKKMMVKLSDKTYVGMIIIGIYLIYSNYKILNLI